MKWNWQNADWPDFRYEAASLMAFERKFLQAAGEVIGAVRHFNEDDSYQLRIEVLSDEAVKTSETHGSVCLNSFGRFAKWISASIMPPPSSVPAR
ncbi:DUF4172 domain-containing protein [Agrobacterium sp. RAC06]|uniref:DUF4172 domain-containing protein n=1 Tax=Agrobacterium sp. RAC06 TaxID=1842536 RepID=UPI00083CE57D|nr:hypothetical protein BSY240_4453 [Agrobacterium sp. RAC06]